MVWVLGRNALVAGSLDVGLFLGAVLAGLGLGSVGVVLLLNGVVGLPIVVSVSLKTTVATVGLWFAINELLLSERVKLVVLDGVGRFQSRA